MSGIKLRDYQEETVEAVFSYLNETTTNGVVVLPTGAGKTPVGTTITERVVRKGGRVLIVSHVKELLEQTFNTFSNFMPDLVRDDRVGLYSAGLNRRDMHNDVIIAGVQSIYKRINLFGAFKLLIVDEAHLIPETADGMYRQLIDTLLLMNPHMRVVGLTATPYRLSSGIIYGGDGIFEDVIYEVGVRRLIADGYLCPLIGHPGITPNLDGVHIQAGDFKSDELAEKCREIVVEAVSDLISVTEERHHILAFAVTVSHAEEIAWAMREHGYNAKVVSGKTTKTDRQMMIDGFKSGAIRCLVNVGVLTIGFDAPMVDCVAMFRPTKSPGLYYQILGRGFRLHPDKDNCLILDFAGNIGRHGPVDEIKPPLPSEKRSKGDVDEERVGGKVCPSCKEILKLGTKTCYVCDYEFPQKEVDHETKADRYAQPLSSVEVATYPITGFDVCTWKKTGVEEQYAHRYPDTVKVDYHFTTGRVSEWMCPGHGQQSTKARKSAEKWYSKLMPGRRCPDTAAECVEQIRAELAKEPYESIINVPMTVKVDESQKYPKMMNVNYKEEGKAQPCYGCKFYNVSGYCDKTESLVPGMQRNFGCKQFAEIPF